MIDRAVVPPIIPPPAPPPTRTYETAVKAYNVRSIGDTLFLDIACQERLSNVIFEIEEPDLGRIIVDTIFWGKTVEVPGTYHWGAYFAPGQDGLHIARIYADEICPRQVWFAPEPGGESED